MTTQQPRRPAQLRPEQIDMIQGEADTAYNSELAHTSARAVVPLTDDNDPGVAERVLALIGEEGVDVLAESWVHSPEDSLPGILWRGFLLREWIRRFPNDADTRFAAATAANPESNTELVTTPSTVRALWDDVLRGNFTGDFAEVLRQSARLTDFLSAVEPTWIDDDGHPLATEVTRRETAMARTAREFHTAGELLVHGRL